MRESIEISNQQREVTQYVNEYAILELLGSGAFGSVTKVRKRDSGQTYYALKEVSLSIILCICGYAVEIKKYMITICDQHQHDVCIHM